MLDTTTPYLSYILVTYGLAFVVLLGIWLVQRHQYRKTMRQLEMFKQKP